jgi:hypothetical protein
MPVNTILSVDVLAECEAGQRHVAKASLLIGHTPGGVAPIDRLIEQQSAGASFVAASPDGSGIDLPVKLASCPCGKGYLIRPAGLVDEYPARG